jgi:ABC-type Fe3+-citrate transport system substrate-binding protein
MQVYVIILIGLFLVGGCSRKKWKQKTDVVKVTSEQQEAYLDEEPA